ncbi:MAG: hypothetical protein LBQ75_03345 [Zoogloeaceae bacterium]|nr:hypothetical protein [Zoogloeaceae bacterium]
MKRALTDFFSSCRKWLIVVLLATNLSGCAFLGDRENQTLIAVVMAPIALPVFAVLAVIGSMGQAGRETENQINSNAAQVRESLAQKAHAYLKTACEQDERLSIKPGITLGEDNKILILRRGDAPLPLLKTAPRETASAEILKYRMLHYKENWRDSINMVREIQYGYSIPWDDYDTLYTAWFAFPPSAAVEQKFFIETSKGKYLQRASKAFWEQAGLGARVLNESPTFEDRRRSGKPYYLDATVYKDASEQACFDLPIDAPPSTKYALSIEDISTLEDRAHWVARGRLALIERKSGEAVAEYVGFAANIGQGGMQADSSSRRWKNSTGRESSSRYERHTELCPNAAENPRQIVRSFLQKILNAKQP